MTDTLKELTEAGVAVWLDDLSRERLVTGSLADADPGLPRRRRHHQPDDLPEGDQRQRVPTTTRSATWPSAAWTSAKRFGRSPTYDVRWALRRAPAGLRRERRRRRPGLDRGRPALAHDTERTIAEARALWWLVDRPNLFIKIPATKAGVPAIAQTLAEGISVNVTLIFSLERYAEVIEAFLAGLERAQAAGHDLSRLGSVASFFVSRVDTEVDKRLDKIGSDEAKALRGKAAVANARLAYKLYEEKFDSDRWRALEAAGAKPQRPLWASTSTKDPAYDDTMYVVDLVAKGTVNTMPEATMHAIADHGVITGDTDHGPLRRRPAGARRSSPRSGSTTTTSSRCSRTRASRSSRPRGPS